eukprot:NODE_2735_length_885_cov_237.731325.p2 GENE.NODE_2735_length_885_cov_237.731325~~NODE_2735_length_885_cov_237.731325.p2  ORF type:complete len:230 (-),score=77.31 NODE_2735_length_885_cov_237.731325:178-867(-)
MGVELPVLRKVAAVLLNLQFLLAALGHSVLQFIVGGLSVWMPDYMTQEMGFSKVDAGLYLGAVTFFSTLVGTIGGGVILDKVAPPVASRPTEIRTRGLAACRVCFGFVLLVTPFCMPLAWVRRPKFFFPLLIIGDTGIFAMSVPMYTGILSAVEPDLRGLAVAFSLGLFGHALGDIWSPVVVGYIKDETGSLHDGMILLTWWILWGLLVYGLASTGLGYRLQHTRQLQH